MAIRQPQPPPRLRRSTDDDDWSEFHGVAMSEEQFLDLDDREETDLEYIDGIAYCKAVVDEDHRDLSGEFDYRFGSYRRLAGGSFGPEFRVRMRSGRHQKPDAGFWRKGTPATKGSLPTVAVEVRSRSETMEEQRRNCRLYRDAGVPVVWLVDPVGRVVEVFDDGHDDAPLPRDGVLTTALMPGFALPVAELFAVLDRETG